MSPSKQCLHMDQSKQGGHLYPLCLLVPRNGIKVLWKSFNGWWGQEARQYTFNTHKNQFYTNSPNPCSILVRVIPVCSRYVQKYGKLQYVLNRNSKLILI